jgi:hypothetical protein
MGIEDLFFYYLGCEDSKSARNHIVSVAESVTQSQWLTPCDAYMDNRHRLFICHQLNYLELRDDHCTPYDLLVY